MSNLEDVLSKLVYSNVSQTGAGGGTPTRRWLWGSGGKAPSRWAIFVSFWKKKSYLNPIGSHFTLVQSHFKELDFQHFKATQKTLVVQSSFCN